MIIDDTFRGIPEPLSRFNLGRPDITDRPGDALIEIVQSFRADGGFGRLQADRRAAHVEPEARRPLEEVAQDRRLSRWFEGDLSDDLDAERDIS